MFTKSAMASVPVLLLLAFPATATAQDAAPILDNIRKALGGELPPALRITAAGSGYAPAPAGAAANAHAGAPGRFRIETYTLDLDLGGLSAAERLVRVDQAAGTSEAARHTETRTVQADSPWPDQWMLWTTPHAFVAAAASRPATASTDTLFGTEYTVLTITTTGGRQVRGYVNGDNILERTRTEWDDPASGTVQLETVFLSWKDFDGVKFPSLIVQKRGGQLSRILVVDAAAPGGAPASTAQIQR